MKTYTIIGGVDGSGKSSLTGVLKTTRTDFGKSSMLIVWPSLWAMTLQPAKKPFAVRGPILTQICLSLNRLQSRSTHLKRHSQSENGGILCALILRGAEYRNSELLLKGDYRPQWIDELVTYLADLL